MKDEKIAFYPKFNNFHGSLLVSCRKSKQNIVVPVITFAADEKYAKFYCNKQNQFIKSTCAIARSFL